MSEEGQDGWEEEEEHEGGEGGGGGGVKRDDGWRGAPMRPSEVVDSGCD